MPAQKIATIPHAEYHNHWIKIWPESRGRKTNPSHAPTSGER